MNKPSVDSIQGSPCGSAGKDSACNAGDLGLVPGLGRSPGKGKGYPLQYSGLENFMDYIYSPWGHKESDNGILLSKGTGPREGNGSPLQYSCLGNAMDR